MSTYDFVDSGDVGSVSPELAEPAKPTRRMLQPTKDELRRQLDEANDRASKYLVVGSAFAACAFGLLIAVIVQAAP